MNNNKFNWVNFYKEFAEKLLAFKNDRTSLVEMVKESFTSTGIDMPKLESEELKDIDPFTVFGTFNKKLKDYKRISLCEFYKSKLGMTSSVPISFEAIPILNNQSSAYYSFLSEPYRKESDIDNLWDFFECALNYSKEDNELNKNRFISAFDTVINMRNIGNSKCTMGLFWSVPEFYINLDNTNVKYIYNSGKLPVDLVDDLPDQNIKLTGKKYLEIRESIQEFLLSNKSDLHSFLELSLAAWESPKKSNTNIKESNFSYSSDKIWFPKDYEPGLTVSDWIQLLKDDSVFNESSLAIVKRMYDYGGQATCKQLAVKYGENVQFYNAGSVALAKRIADKTNCKMMNNRGDNYKWWPVLYVGKQAEKDDLGVFIWKLRDELYKAIEQVDMSSVSLYSQFRDNFKNCGYWWLNANPKIWSFSDIEVGETQSYTMFNENNHKRRIFQNFLDAKVGDLIIGYESYPVKKIVALARICKQQDGKQIYFEKVEGLSNPIDYATLKSYPELEKMEYFISPQGSLFKLSKKEYDFIMDLIREENPVVQYNNSNAYTKEDFLNEVFISENKYDTLVSVLRNKKNIILQGAPGVGKTFAAKRLAYSMMNEKDDSRIEFVQFHQNYSYEDFVMGYKPVDDGFELKNGIFYRFCQKAANHPDKDFFFIIDEINRGNMSKIFGELLMLIEKDYRGAKATLAYNGMSFSVPKNLYIIGMMNTADRSLAMIDYALRRRFSFFEMEPGFDSEGFIKYQKKLNSDLFDDLIDRVKDLNVKIASDRTLGKGFCIGHSYFCGRETCSEEWLREIVDFDILPMLSEYWFDDVQELQNWDNILHGVFQ